MATLLNTRYYDDYFQSLLDVESLYPQCRFIYEPIGISWFDHLDFSNEQVNVIICTDFLTNGDMHDRFRDFHGTMKNFPNHKVIIASPVYQAELDYDIPNVHFICNGADFMYQLSDYNKLDPMEKTFKTPWHWSYISFIPRDHRLSVGCWLAGNNYPNGFVKVNFGVHNNPSWSNYYHHNINLEHEQVELLDKGWQALAHTNYNQSNTIEGYNVPPNNNVLNYTLNLYQQYQNLAVEIIGETTFRQNGVHVSEKFLHSVYGSVLPILIAPANSIAFLQELGFDMFTDVVDQSYDRIKDPEQRMITAIESNKKLLFDRDYALECWHNNKHRFKKNINFCKMHLESRCRNLFLQQLNAYI